MRIQPLLRIELGRWFPRPLRFARERGEHKLRFGLVVGAKVTEHGRMGDA
jgi:hypothetical protein